jgi:hypothetical protein
MVIAERPVARVCPRCSLQIPGWPIYQDGMVSCLHCGFVLRDDGYRHTDFSGLLKRYENARDKITHDEGVRLKARHITLQSEAECKQIVTYWKAGTTKEKLAFHYRVTTEMVQRIIENYS